MARKTLVFERARLACAAVAPGVGAGAAGGQGADAANRDGGSNRSGRR